MNRKDFLTSFGLLSFAGITMKMNTLQNMVDTFLPTEKMPILFLGHGSPMNAIEENEFVTEFRNLAQKIPTPKAIICISAHWETKGTWVTAMEKPKTIHDFGGFPKALFEVQYPALGSPTLAQEVKDTLTGIEVGLDQHWGFDHGAWSVVKHLYPKADIPMIQLSLDATKDPSYHYNLAKELTKLRHKGVLIIGSGNMVHNLKLIAWDKLNSNNYSFDWAKEAQEKMKSFIADKNHQALIQYTQQGNAFRLAIPTPEHFLPLLYILGLQQANEEAILFNDKAVAGSLTMTSLYIP